MNYPQWICADCGLKHGKTPPGVACWHEDKCDVCGEVKPCTEPRDFGHLKETWKNDRIA